MATSNLINLTTFLDPATLILSDLLSKNDFLIPDYQRDYSWTEEEVELLKLVRERVPRLASRPQFPEVVGDRKLSKNYFN